jgi:Ca2+-binding EF-hand superfamily protein
LPEGWVEVAGEDGSVYGYNEGDGSTTWERPGAKPAGGSDYITATDVLQAVAANGVDEDTEPLTEEELKLVTQKQLLGIMDRLSMRPIDLFNAFDQDGDASISTKEFTEGLQRISVESRGRSAGSLSRRMSITDIDSLVTIVDADGDGMIDMKEWRAYMKESFRELARRPSQKQLKAAAAAERRRQSNLVHRRESELRSRDSKGVPLPPGWKQIKKGGEVLYKHHINGIEQKERPTEETAAMGARRNTATNILLPIKHSEEQKLEEAEESSEAMHKLAKGMRRINMRPVDMFKALDVDRGGTITCEELEDGIKRLGIKGLDDKDMKELFLIFDSDGGGDISVSEWKEHHQNWNRAQTKKKQLDKKRRSLEARQERRGSGAGGEGLPPSGGPLLQRTSSTASLASVASDQTADYEAAYDMSTSTPAANASAATSLPDGWIQVDDGDGGAYYYNQADGITSWERPTDSYEVEEGWTQSGVDMIQPAEYDAGAAQ